MTNQEKYKTVQERADAFGRFCESRRNCDECPLDGNSFTSRGCILNWLEMEAKEEATPKPCPFCGGKASAFDSRVSVFAHVRCDNCQSTTGKYNTKEDAIAAWNRRVK